MFRTLTICCALLFMVPIVEGHPGATAKTTYLANEGIMVSDGHTTILFDPLYPNGFGTYQMVPEPMRKALMAGSEPFTDIDAVFISHMHADHFSVDEVILYLQTHAKVRLYAPLQAVELMQERTDDTALFERVTAVDLARLDAPLSFSEGGLDIDVVRIPHAGWPGRAEVSNLVWRVSLGDGVTVMHLGDADPLDAHYAPHAAHWTKKHTDTAYPPYWFFLSPTGRQILKSRLNTINATAIHVPIKLPPRLVSSGADFFHEPGETRIIKGVGSN